MDKRPESADSKSACVLLIEDNPGDVRLIREALAETTSGSFDLVHADRLSSGVGRLAKGHIDLVLLDLSLPDSHGIETLVKLQAYTPDVPVVVLTGFTDEAMAVQAVQAGAQDYLVKGHFDGHLLIRAMRYAMERHRLQETIRNLSWTDELTGLRNRRGFLILAEQHLKLARRSGRGMMLILADLDGLKQINDRFGHLEGDLALVETARILRETFRESDIVARLGGDEFVVLWVDTTCPPVARLQEALERYSKETDRGYQVSLSMGVAPFDPVSAPSIEALLAEADEVLYCNKRNRSRA